MIDSLCSLFSEWEDCSGCDGSGYDTGDCVSVCSNGQLFVAKSLADNNTDEPWEGFTSSPRTWEVRSMCYWLNYIGTDCDGATLSVGDAIASCKNLSDLETRLVGLINQKQDQLLNCAGVEHAAGDRVPSCTEMQAADATKQGQLVSCAGDDHAAGASVPSCNEMTAAIDDAIAGIPPVEVPVLKSCAGNDLVDGDAVVKCDEFDDLLAQSLDECIAIRDGGATCGDIKKLVAIECPSGGGSVLATVTDAGIRAGRLSYQNDGDSNLTDPFPADPYDHSELYDYFSLTGDHVGGSVDEALLDKSRIFCGEIDAPCDGKYQLYTEAVIYAAQQVADKALGRFVFKVDGAFVETDGGGVKPTSTFTNFGADYREEELTHTLTAGVHTVCMYYVSGSSGFPTVQVTTSGSPLVDIRRVVE